MLKKRNYVLGGIAAAFFLSGSAALVYETLWVRLFTLIMGHTTMAVSGVLAAYMAGLSLGSCYGGAAADRIPSRNLLKLFALLEAATFLTAWLVHPASRLLESRLLHAGILSYPPLAQSALWFAASFIPLLIPTTIMGATLPVLIKWAANNGSDRDIGDYTGLLYGINTLGAVCGSCAAGFFLIPRGGITLTFLAAGLLNIISAAAVYLMYLFADEKQPVPVAESQPQAPLEHQRLFVFVLFVSGFAAMSCEVAWTRAFASILGSSTYSFTIMLFTFLLGLGLGSISFPIYKRAFGVPLHGLIFAFAAVTASALAYLPFMNKLPFLFTRLFAFVAHGESSVLFVQFLLCASIMIVPAFFMGLLFPCVINIILTGAANAGRVTGRLYAANTLGNIAGSFLTGILLLPAFGAEHALVTAIAAFGLCTVVLLITEKTVRPLVRLPLTAAFTIAVLLGIWIRPPWDPYIMSSGAFLYAPEYRDDKSFSDFVKNLRRYQLLYYKDGISATIAVLQTPWGERFLRTNGKTDASTGGDMTTQLLLGYIPRLLRASPPRTALVIGLGSGVTAGALSIDPDIGPIDCVEIEPSVASAAVLFSQVNHDIMFNRRLRMIYADARHYLAATDKKYDIITSEPSNPWIAGVASLFTRESFELARERLTDDGIFCQWFHSYSMGIDDFRMVMKTFAAVFPSTILMTTSHNDFFLIGAKKPWTVDYAAVQRTFNEMPGMQRDLSIVGLGHPFKLLATTFLLNDDAFRTFAQSAPVHTDDHPVLEFSAPLHLRKGDEAIIFDQLQAAKKTLLPENVTNLTLAPDAKEELCNMTGESFMRSHNLEAANALFTEALKLNQRNARAWTNTGRVHNAMDRHLQAEQAFSRAIALDPEYALAWFHRGMLYINQGLDEKGTHDLEEGLQKSPYDPMGSLQLGLIYLKTGRVSDAQKLFRRALSRPIPNTELRNSLVYSLNTSLMTPAK